MWLKRPCAPGRARAMEKRFTRNLCHLVTLRNFWEAGMSASISKRQPLFFFGGGGTVSYSLCKLTNPQLPGSSTSRSFFGKYSSRIGPSFVLGGPTRPWAKITGSGSGIWCGGIAYDYGQSFVIIPGSLPQRRKFMLRYLHSCI